MISILKILVGSLLFLAKGIKSHGSIVEGPKSHLRPQNHRLKTLGIGLPDSKIISSPQSDFFLSQEEETIIITSQNFTSNKSDRFLSF